MAKEVREVDHDGLTSTATMTGEAAKGAVKGTAVAAGATLLGAGGAMAALGAAVSNPVGALAVTAAVLAVGTLLYFASPVLLAGAALGVAYGLAKGSSKVREEKRAFNRSERDRQQNIETVIGQAQQQAYMAGARDGQAHVINKLQEIQAQQEQQTNFAAKFADKKGAVKPEQIIQQREAAKAAPQQLGA